jgi:DNA repair exonuclease SbcCD nuclease subunit
MSLNFRFGIVSDLHIAVEETILNHPKRFHLVEVSIPSFQQVTEHLKSLDIDFLLLPGD